MTDHPPIDEILDRLRTGNRRFVEGESTRVAAFGDELREELAGGQAPHTVVIGCSDSRVPPEIVFDQAPGDLFVIRVAGNIITPPQIGSVEFAVASLGTPLVVVMGHSLCGAVGAAIDVDAGGTPPSPGLASIVEPILPAVRRAKEEVGDERAVLMKRAARLNVLNSVEALLAGSAILSSAVEARNARVVGAKYQLDTGMVDFFDDE